MSRYITGFSVSKTQAEEQQLKAKGFLKKDAKDANAKAKFGITVNLWSKKKEGEPPVTRIQISYNDEMAKGLEDAGYTKGDTVPTLDGDVTLWSFCGCTPYDIPIVDTGFSCSPEMEAQLMKNGYEKIPCNSSGVYGYGVYTWVKREKPTFIQDVTATNSYDKDVDLFKAGYIRIDDPTNTIFGGYKSSNFLWYRLTTDPSNPITDLKISTNTEEYQQYQSQWYELVNVNLNKGAGGREVYLWYKPWGQDKPVQSMMLLFHKFATKIFEECGIQVIDKNINEGDCGDRFLCFWQ